MVPTKGLSQIVIFRFLVLFNLYPGIDQNEIGHKGGNVAFYDGCVTPQNVLVHDIHRITLENDCKRHESYTELSGTDY